MIHGLSRFWRGKKDRCRSLKEREREKVVVINGGRRENRKSWFESRSRRCPLREIDAGETDGNLAAGLMNFFGTSFNWNLFFPPSSAFITNATVIANSGFDRSNYFSSSVRALIACFMAGVSHLSSNRSPDKRSDYRRFDSNEGLKYRLINSMLVKNWREFVPRAGVSPWNFSGSRERLWNWCKTRSGLKKKKTKLRVHIDGNIHTRTCSEKKYRICNKIYTYICIYFLKKIHNATSVRA